MCSWALGMIIIYRWISGQFCLLFREENMNFWWPNFKKKYKSSIYNTNSVCATHGWRLQAYLAIVNTDSQSPSLSPSIAFHPLFYRQLEGMCKLIISFQFRFYFYDQCSVAAAWTNPSSWSI